MKTRLEHKFLSVRQKMSADGKPPRVVREFQLILLEKETGKKLKFWRIIKIFVFNIDQQHDR